MYGFAVRQFRLHKTIFHTVRCFDAYVYHKSGVKKGQYMYKKYAVYIQLGLKARYISLLAVLETWLRNLAVPRDALKFSDALKKDNEHI